MKREVEGVGVLKRQEAALGAKNEALVSQVGQLQGENKKLKDLIRMYRAQLKIYMTWGKFSIH